MYDRSLKQSFNNSSINNIANHLIDKIANDVVKADEKTSENTNEIDIFFGNYDTRNFRVILIDTEVVK